MYMKSKKALSLALASILAISCLTACGTKTDDNGANTDKTETTTAAKDKGPEENKMPIANGDVTLSIYTYIKPGSSTIYKDLSEHPVVKIIAEKTGLNLTFVHPPQNDDGTFFNTTIASGVIPDIVMGNFNSYPGGTEAAIEDGVLMDITDLVDKYGYFYDQIMSTQTDYVKKRTLSDSGKLVKFCSMIQPPFLDGRVHVGLTLRKDLLEKNKMDMPITLADYEEYFKMCQKEGIKQPLAISASGMSDFDNYNFIASAFGVTYKKFYVDDKGKVQYPRTQEGYKEFLKLMNDWYKKGYITSDFLSQSKSDLQKAFQAGTAGMIPAGNWLMNQFNVVGKTSIPDFYAVGSPYPRQKEGDAIKFAQQMQSINDNGKFVSADCENPVEAVKFLDYLYSPDLYDLTAWGPGTEEFPTYDVDASGKRTMSEWMKKNPDVDYTTMRERYTLNEFQVKYNEEMEKQQYEPYPEKMETWDNWSNKTTQEGCLPNVITPTVDESRELSGIMTTVDTYTDEMTLKFITGEMSIDDNWDSYVKQVNSLKVDRAAEINQGAYDRFLAR